MAKNSVGIYISAKYVDIVELGGSLNAPHLLNFIREEIPAPASPPKGAELKIEAPPQDLTTAALAAGLKKLRGKPTGAYTILAPGDVMLRYFSMPRLPRSEQIQAVRFEARKYVPFKIDGVVSDFKILPSPQEKEIMSVFFIAATKERLNLHLGIFKKAGLDAVGVDIILFALIRVLLLEKKIQPKESAAVLYIDNNKESASVHIIDKGMPFLSRDFKINTDDKEALFEKAASELRVSLGYYRRQRPQAEISKIIVCGESLFAGLDAYIADELKIITETLEQLQGVRGAEKARLSSIIAIGAALGGLGRSAYTANLSPMARAIEKKKLANILLMESIAALVIILLTFIFSSAKLGSVTGKLKAIEQKHQALPKDTSGLDLEGLNRFKEKKFEEVEFLWLALNNRASWAQKLDMIAKDIPDGVWIDNLTAQDNFAKKGSPGGYPSSLARSIYISGSSFSLDSAKELEYITKFFTSLKKNRVFMRYFKDLNLGSMDKREVEDYQVTSFKIFADPSEELPATGEDVRWRRR